MELALAAAATFVHDSATAEQGGHIGVAGMAISAPIVLPDPGAKDSNSNEFESAADALLVTCEITLEGRFKLEQGGAAAACAAGQVVLLQVSTTSEHNKPLVP